LKPTWWVSAVIFIGILVDMMVLAWRDTMGMVKFMASLEAKKTTVAQQSRAMLHQFPRQLSAPPSRCPSRMDDINQPIDHAFAASARRSCAARFKSANPSLFVSGVDSTGGAAVAVVDRQAVDNG
jgi:hypothetical protein